MAKKIQAIVKLQIEGGAATAAPPVGPALGQHGANIMAFVKEYNEKTASMKGDVVPVEITIYQDKSFTFELKSPPAAALILKAAKIQKGASEMLSGLLFCSSRNSVPEAAMTPPRISPPIMHRLRTARYNTANNEMTYPCFNSQLKRSAPNAVGTVRSGQLWCGHAT